MSDSPQCRTNASLPNNTIDQSDQLEIACSAVYYGYWRPEFSCAPGLPGRASNVGTSSTPAAVSYRRLIPASDIADGAVLGCTISTFTRAVRPLNHLAPRLPADADIPRFHFHWNTSNIRVVKSTGQTIGNFSIFLVPFLVHDWAHSMGP